MFPPPPEGHTQCRWQQQDRLQMTGRRQATHIPTQQQPAPPGRTRVAGLQAYCQQQHRYENEEPVHLGDDCLAPERPAGNQQARRRRRRRSRQGALTQQQIEYRCRPRRQQRRGPVHRRCRRCYGQQQRDRPRQQHVERIPRRMGCAQPPGGTDQLPGPLDVDPGAQGPQIDRDRRQVQPRGNQPIAPQGNASRRICTGCRRSAAPTQSSVSVANP